MTPDDRLAAIRAELTSWFFDDYLPRRRLSDRDRDDRRDRQPGVLFDTSTLATEPLETAYERSKQLADRVVVDALAEGLPARFVHPPGSTDPHPAPPPESTT